MALAFVQGPGRATSVMPPAYSLTARESFEELVNQCDVFCDATLDTVQGPLGSERLFMRDPQSWKGEGLPARFEVFFEPFGTVQTQLDRTQGRRYRMMLLHAFASPGGRPGVKSKHARFAALRFDPLPVWQAKYDYTRSTVDTIVARARFDTLCSQADLIVLAHHSEPVMRDRDGVSTMSQLLRVDRVIKGAASLDTLVFQAPYGFGGRALLFLKRHGPNAWETVWPGAGVHRFDTSNRERKTGLPLQSYLERIERNLGSAVVR